MNRERAQKTGLTLKIDVTPSLNHYLNDLALSSGKQGRLSLMAEAIALTAYAVQKFTEGYVIQIIEQSMSYDKFNYPLLPHHLYMEMKQGQKPQDPRSIDLTVPDKTEGELQTLCKALGIGTMQDAVHFSLYFAHRIATELHAASGIARLASVDRKDRSFGEIIKTPYDYSLRNDFNRAWQSLHKWAYQLCTGGNAPARPPEPRP